MTNEQKLNIVAETTTYMKDKGLSLNELCRQTGINVGYLSPMLRGTFTIPVKDKTVELDDKWFLQLAAFIGLSMQKTYWETLSTRQFVLQIAALKNAKETGKTAMIIGSTGVGKTKNTDVFCHKMPLHTYRVTVSSLYKLVDIVTELTELLGLEFASINSARIQTNSVKIRVDKIVAKLKEIKRNGGNPIIIFDEGENMEMSVLKMLKGLYDALKDHCAIVVIGTEQLLNKLLNLRKRNRDAIPQLYRRFKAGLVTLPGINKEIDFAVFYDKYCIEKPLRNLLTRICDNYGELNDYLEAAMREADRTGEPLTEQLFRKMFTVPQ
ncbi:ATP-binding protein [Limnovirga soli]|uniref:AAA family ATPase n=1 Tax=Limnovirga soli TaxID=2656915 RepID=A0A8J8FBA3_9BACT|nr:ATP-binding protein [Limnovirga soli]NNV54565.1 AAA family ATPase [Limnovirga soli]